jgi:hypothetical protein
MGGDPPNNDVPDPVDEGSHDDVSAQEPSFDCDRVGTVADKKVQRVIRATEHVRKTTYVELVEIAYGCPENCAACGAYSGEEDSIKLRELPPDQIRANITRVIAGTGLRVADLMRGFITTGIDIEPLHLDNFTDFAKMVPEETGGKSRAVCISHGLRCINRKGTWQPSGAMKRRLDEVADLMISDVLPLFVLSCDIQRNSAMMGVPTELVKRKNELETKINSLKSVLEGYGDDILDRDNEVQAGDNSISEELMEEFIGCTREIADLEEECWGYVVEANAQSYAETLIGLEKPIKARKRVTVSLQGDDKEKSPVYIGKVMMMWQRACEILEEKGYGHLLNDIHIEDEGRFYVNLGRAETVLGGLDPSRHCPVVPDEEFLKKVLWKEPYRTNRAIVDINGRVLFQVYRARRTYDDTIEGQWKQLDLDGKAPIDDDLDIRVKELTR